MSSLQDTEAYTCRDERSRVSRELQPPERSNVPLQSLSNLHSLRASTALAFAPHTSSVSVTATTAHDASLATPSMWYCMYTTSCSTINAPSAPFPPRPILRLASIILNARLSRRISPRSLQKAPLQSTKYPPPSCRRRGRVAHQQRAPRARRRSRDFQARVPNSSP
eukprot:529553-Rhodomonas_salina.1